MHPLSSFNQTINDMISVFEDQHENKTLSHIGQIIQEHNWLYPEEAEQLDRFKKRLIQARVDSGHVLIRQIKEISGFLKAGSLAQMPKDILLKILINTDIKTLQTLTYTNSFFHQLTKDPHILLSILNQIDVKKRVELAIYLGSLVKCLNLDTLKPLDKKTLQSLVNACPNIQALSLNDSKNTSDQKLHIIKNLNKLQSLDVSRSITTTDKEAKVIARELTQLRSLNLAYCYGVTDEGVKAIARGLTQLRSLNLTCCYGITEEGIKAIAQELTQLRSLNLTYCYNVDKEGIEAIARELTQLRSLNLTCCYFTEGEVEAIAQNLTKLESIDLGGCNITDEEVNIMAQRMTQLQSLNLSYCNNITDKGLKAIAQNLTQLRSLDLSHCDKITDEGVKAIKEGLIQLQTLGLSY